MADKTPKRFTAQLDENLGFELPQATREQRIRAAQDFFCSLVDPNRVLSEELIADRRAEAARELARDSSTPQLDGGDPT